MRDLKFWQFIEESLVLGVPVMVLYVVESSGSSPGRQGFKMAVTSDGNMIGSIGGGIMEHKLIELAKDKLKSFDLEKAQIKKQIHSKDVAKNQSGMICSGEQTVVFIRPTEFDLRFTRDVLASLQSGNPTILTISNQGFAIQQQPNGAVPDFEFVQKDAGNWYFKERLGYKDSLYIVGGGHVSLAFSKLMSMLDFNIKVFDDREGLYTLEQNVFASEKKVINYENLADYIPEGSNSYVVIMTFGYRTDEIAIRSLIGKNFKYLGLMGSQAKIKQMFGNMREDGISEDMISKVFAPIGIQISSKTPEEIAISIAAEIIQCRNQGIKIKVEA